MKLTRRTLAIVVVAAVVVSALATALASALIRSPSEDAARTAPPPPTQILVQVEERQISTSVVTRGTGRFGSPQELTVTRSALKTGPQVITTVPEPGAVLTEGSVLMTVSGRPVFLISGERPSYRDLGPGIVGPDVEQLEVALGRLGLNTGRVDDTYDQYTGLAVTEMYLRAGYQPVVAANAQLDRVRPLESTLIGGSQARAGVQFPADELIFVAATEVRVSETPAVLGAAPNGPLATVTDSKVAIDGSLTIDEAKLVKPGMEVVIDEPTLGITARGTVERVADRPGTDGVDGFHVYVSTQVADPPPTLVGASVRLNIPVQSTGTAVLAVPVSAVSLAPDGSSRVQRSVNGTVESVPVVPGVSGDGYVAITVPDGSIKAGDQLVIGVAPNGSTGGG